MTDDVLMPSDELIERALGRRAPRGPDADLLRLITATAERTPQRRAWWPVGLPRMGEPARRVIWIAVLLLALALALGAIVAGGLTPSPAVVVEPLPSGSSPSPSSGPTIDPSAPVAIEDVTNGPFSADQTYTSRRFEPWVTFRLAAGLGGTYFRPSPDTSARSLVFPYRSGTGELRLMRPYAVDCGTPDAHPDAATLAAAILARPGLSDVRDLGTDPYPNQDAGSRNLISGTYAKRVLLIDASNRPFESGISDPDRCRLLMDPASQDPAIEIRGDMTALLILTDVGGELVVVRVSEQGYDAPSGAIALRVRDGYQSPPDLFSGPTPIYLGDIRDLETVYDLHGAEPAADPLASAAPEASPTTSPDARTSGEPPPSALADLAIEEAGDSLSPSRTYTSDRFLPQMRHLLGIIRAIRFD